MYRMTDLVDATGLPARRIRYYRARRILPPPQGFGRWATYTPTHLRILLDLVNRREYQHKTLTEEASAVQSQYRKLFPPHERHPDLAT